MTAESVRDRIMKWASACPPEPGRAYAIGLNWMFGTWHPTALNCLVAGAPVFGDLAACQAAIDTLGDELNVLWPYESPPAAAGRGPYHRGTRIMA